jgi:ferrous iron transport protein B
MTESAASPASSSPASRSSKALVLVAGNPNAGKTSVFNALTGARAKVGNYPGVTVTRRSASLELPGREAVEVVDLPGTYSLAARSREEQVAADAVLGREIRPPDAVLVVADATALARNLYLALQIVETGVPTVLGLSMTDEARRLGIELDLVRLSNLLGVAVVPLVATRGEGIEELRHALSRALAEARSPRPPELELSEALTLDVTVVAEGIARWLPGLPDRAARAWAMWALLSIGDDELDGIPADLRSLVGRRHAEAVAAGRDLDQEIIAARYRLLDAVVAASVSTRAPVRRRTERIDAVLTHRVAGFVVFSLVMLLVFEALFTGAEPAIELVEAGIASAQGLARTWLPPGPLADLMVQGVIAGVGNVVVFVPQIALLFLFIGLLEDSGYLSRVALVIDRVMGRVGLHGKAFVPMLSGFACAVPAVMATRTIESRRDRLLTMAVLPLMSCSARLPVYVLITAAVFDPGRQVLGVLSLGALVLLCLYLLSVTMTLGAATVLRRTILAGPRPALLLELPPYRLPTLRNLLTSTWQQVRTFLVDAGTIILAMTILLWGLLSYPKPGGRTALSGTTEPARLELASLDAAGMAGSTADPRGVGEALRHSFAGRLGRALEPALAPLGLDWRIGIGILGAFAAREVFVSTLGIVFDIADADEGSRPLRAALREARRADGSPLMTPLSGTALLVFFVVACQCMSTLAVLGRESGSWRWPAFVFAYMTVLAYSGALIVYQGGRALGLGLS